MKETVNLNIPSMTVNEVVDRLAIILGNAICRNIPFAMVPTPFLWGPAGVGKSAGVYQLAERLGESTGKRVEVTDVRLTLFAPVDLRGVPAVDRETSTTEWFVPKIFDMDKSADCINILFLDELSAALQSVQVAAYQICLDRRIGEHMLPDNCIVIAAGNRLTDQSVSYKMPKALCNRLLHFDVRADYEAWRKWAVKNGISDKIIAFLGFDNSRLTIVPENSDLAYATPRSWEFVSTVMDLAGEDTAACRSLIAAAVGNGMAIEFEAFCRGASKMPDPNAVLCGRCSVYPKTHDVMYAFVSALVARIAKKGEGLTADELENAFCYVQRLPEDFVMLFASDLRNISSIGKKLMKCHSFQTWLNRH